MKYDVEIFETLNKVIDTYSKRLEIIKKYKDDEAKYQAALQDFKSYHAINNVIQADQHALSMDYNDTSYPDISALILESQAIKYKERNYDPILFSDEKSANQFLLYIAGLVHAKPMVNKKFDIIIQTNGPPMHATPFSFRIENNKLTIGYIDGSNNGCNLRFVRKFFNEYLAKNRINYVGFEFNGISSNKIQCDTSSCVIYSIIYLGQMTRFDNKKLKLSFKFTLLSRLITFEAFQLIAPNYIKYSQSTYMRKVYLEMHSNASSGLTLLNKPTLKEYFETHSAKVPTNLKKKDRNELVLGFKEQNRSIDYKRLKYYQMAMKLFNPLNLEELGKILTHRLNRKVDEKYLPSKTDLIRIKAEDESSFVYNSIPKFLRFVESYTQIATTASNLYHTKHLPIPYILGAASIFTSTILAPIPCIMLWGALSIELIGVNYLHLSEKAFFTLCGAKIVAGLMVAPLATTILFSGLGQLLANDKEALDTFLNLYEDIYNYCKIFYYKFMDLIIKPLDPAIELYK